MTATPISVAVHSTPGYFNDALFFRTLDECRARFNLVRVIAEEGSAVAAMARHWCRRNRVRLVIVLPDETVPARFDRLRVWRAIAEMRPACGLFFNQADHFVTKAHALYDRGIPVSLVYPTQDNLPTYTTWSPGVRFPATPDIQTVARNVRRGRPRKKLSPEEAARRQREAKVAWRDKNKMIKKLSQPMAYGGAVPKKRKRRATG